MNWEHRLRTLGDGIVVDKGVSVKYDGMKLPRFISEYLLSEFLRTSEREDSAVSAMTDFTSKHIPRAGTMSEWQYRLKSGEPCELIDNFRVSVQIEKRDPEPQVQIPSIGIQRGRISGALLKRHPRLMREGLWGKATLKASDGEVWIESFTPFQISDVSLDEYCEIRNEFNLQEWVEILVSTMGLSPAFLEDTDQSLVVLSRLLPLVQGQTFFIEMGPPGTGKTFVLDKLSTRSFVISGSKVSPASLFYNVQSRKEGLIRHYSALLLDEIDKVGNNEIGDEVVNKLLKYMESGTFDRGGIELSSSASIIMVGNLPAGGRGGGSVLRHLPSKLTHEAYLDRLTGLIPGWKLKPVGQSQSSLTQTWGFSADYFSEILEALRHIDVIPMLNERIAFEECTIRDEKAIVRCVAGLIKLLHPDLQINDRSLELVLRWAVNVRQNILDEWSLLHQIRPRRIAAKLIPA